MKNLNMSPLTFNLLVSGYHSVMWSGNSIAKSVGHFLQSWRSQSSKSFYNFEMFLRSTLTTGHAHYDQLIYSFLLLSLCVGVLCFLSDRDQHSYHWAI